MKASRLVAFLIFLPLFVLAQTEPWQQLDIETPSAREYATLVEIDEVFYLYGGSELNKSNGEKNFLNDLWVYVDDVNWNLNETVGDLPQGRRYHAATAFDGDMFIFGGEIEAGTTTDCWKYDVENNEWIQLPFSDENPKHFHRATAGESKIWITGGLDLTTGQATGDIWGYDPNSQVWSQGTVCPSPRYGHIAYYEDGKVNIIAGRQGDNLLDDAWEYDIAANTWTQKDVPPIPKAIKFAAYDRNGERIFTFGGYEKVGANFEINQSAYNTGVNTILWKAQTDGPAFTDSQARFFSINNNTTMASDFQVLVYGVAEDGNGNYTGETWIYNSVDDPLLGYSESILNDNLRIYPSLSSGMVHIQSKKTIKEIEVYNMLGQLIMEVGVHESDLSIDLSEQYSGTYFIRVLGEDFEISQMIILSQ